MHQQRDCRGDRQNRCSISADSVEKERQQLCFLLSKQQQRQDLVDVGAGQRHAHTAATRRKVVGSGREVTHRRQQTAMPPPRRRKTSCS